MDNSFDAFSLRPKKGRRTPSMVKITWQNPKLAIPNSGKGEHMSRSEPIVQTSAFISYSKPSGNGGGLEGDICEYGRVTSAHDASMAVGKPGDEYVGISGDDYANENDEYGLRVSDGAEKSTIMLSSKNTLSPILLQNLVNQQGGAEDKVIEEILANADKEKRKSHHISLEIDPPDYDLLAKEQNRVNFPNSSQGDETQVQSTSDLRNLHIQPKNEIEKNNRASRNQRIFSMILNFILVFLLVTVLIAVSMLGYLYLSKKDTLK
ncbi:hypothetical protein AYI69_g1242 [Smittium culicis]|uniref:Uncharacterized protein n=1 Tax=Smittium culicis TaxID=133412 RepID=A0A1R1YR63_9FUNG|nr:hypothetical protein AYI69_g1242 [Smittium culicis]